MAENHYLHIRSYSGLYTVCIPLTQGVASSGGPTTTLKTVVLCCRPKSVEQPPSWSYANVVAMNSLISGKTLFCLL